MQESVTLISVQQARPDTAPGFLLAFAGAWTGRARAFAGMPQHRAHEDHEDHDDLSFAPSFISRGACDGSGRGGLFRSPVVFLLFLLRACYSSLLFPCCFWQLFPVLRGFR